MQNELQRELIYDSLSATICNGRHLYRTDLAQVSDNFDVLESYIQLLDPLNEAVTNLQVHIFTKMIF